MLLDPEKIVPSALAAVDDSGAKITYGELVERGQMLARFTEPRSMIFCLCENNIGGLLGYLGFYDNSRVPLLLDASMNRQLLRRLIEIYNPPYLWLPEKYASDFSLKELYREHGYILGMTGQPIHEVHDDLSLLLTTSGSTGSPKLVRHKYGNIEANARNVASAFRWTSVERPICSLPMQYTMGLNVINTHLHVGATLLLTSESLTSPRFWSFIQEWRGTNFTGVPYSYDALFKLKFTHMPLPYLVTFSVGGGKMAEMSFREMATYATHNGKRFISSFGTTETSARMACLQPEYATVKCCSIGKAIPEGELFLKDNEGQVIEEMDATGELCYHGPNVTMGYAECPEDLLRGDDFRGEYATGDLARRDAEGFYFITGRMKRFIKLFGLRVSLDQCEHIIRQKFGEECACTGTDQHIDLYVTNTDIIRDVTLYVCKTMNIPSTALSIHCITEIPKNKYGKIMYSKLNQ